MSFIDKIKKWKHIDFIKKILGIYNFDREAEHLIKKSIEICHRGGWINRIRALRLWNKIQKKYSCSFPPYANYGKDMYIAHAMGIRIGKTATIGERCKLYPFCAIVADLKNDEKKNLEGKPRHATVGNDCIIGYNSIIVGPICIGDDVTIGAKAIVTKDVPSHTVVKGVNEFRAKRIDEIPERYK